MRFFGHKTLELTALAVLLLAAPSRIGAQEITMLVPPQPTYLLDDVVYTPPQGDGWREIEQRANVVRLVYAEDSGDGTLNMRAELAAEVHPIPDPAMVANAASLAMVSYQQRLDERKANLVAQSNVEPLPGTDNGYTYTLISRVGEADFIEVFYVALAPDKSRYLAAKLATKDTDYDEAPYFKPIRDSLVSVRFAAENQDDGERDEEDDEGGQDEDDQDDGDQADPPGTVTEPDA